MRPGESDSGLGDFGDLPTGACCPDAAEFKARWQQIQFRFVDDPQGSVTEAADVIAQVTAQAAKPPSQERQRAISERQRALREQVERRQEHRHRVAARDAAMYRAFLDQLIGPKIGS